MHTTTTSPLAFHGVSKHFGRTRAVDAIDLELPESGIVGLVGRNGAGKTTLLNLAAGLQVPTNGKVITLGEPSTRLSDAGVSRIGLVPHRPSFIEGLTIREYLEVISSFYRVWDRELVERLVNHFRINVDHRILGLSEGQKQMVSILVATAHHPRLLLMDEPLANLDPVARTKTIQILWDTLIEDESLILFSSHVLSDVQKIADRVCCLHEGQLRFFGSLDGLSQRFQRWQFAVSESARQVVENIPPAAILHKRTGGNLYVLDLDTDRFDPPHEVDLRKAGLTDSRGLNLEEVFPYISHE